MDFSIKKYKIDENRKISEEEEIRSFIKKFLRILCFVSMLKIPNVIFEIIAFWRLNYLVYLFWETESVTTATNSLDSCDS